MNLQCDKCGKQFAFKKALLFHEARKQCEQSQGGEQDQTQPKLSPRLVCEELVDEIVAEVLLISEPEEQARWQDALHLPPGWRTCQLRPNSMRKLRANQTLYYSPGGQLFTSKVNVFKFLAKNGVEKKKSGEEDGGTNRGIEDQKENIPDIANRQNKVPDTKYNVDKPLPGFEGSPENIICSPTIPSPPPESSSPPEYSPPPSHSADQEDLTDDSDSDSQASYTSLPSSRVEEELSDCISISDEDILEPVEEEKPTDKKKRKLPNDRSSEPPTKKSRVTVPVVQEPSTTQHKVLMAAYSEWPIPFPKLVKELETDTKLPAKNIVAWFLRQTEENIRKIFDGQDY